MRRLDGGWVHPLGFLTPGLRTILFAALGTGLAAGLTGVGVPATAAAHGAVFLTGLLFAVQSAGDLVGGFIYGGRQWRLPVPYRVVACQAATAAGIGLLALLTADPAGMIPLMFAIGLAQAPGGIASSALLDDVAGKGALGLSYTSMVAAGLIGIAAGNSAGGALQAATAPLALFATAAGVATATYWRRRTLASDTPPHRPAGGS